MNEVTSEVFYRGFRIDSYFSPKYQFRWIYEEEERITPVEEFDLKIQNVTVEDCEKIIDGWLNNKSEHQKPEQMKLF